MSDETDLLLFPRKWINSHLFQKVVDEQVGEERETNQDGKEEEGFERVGLSENEVLDHYEQDQQQLDPYERSPENSIPGKIAIVLIQI